MKVSSAGEQAGGHRHLTRSPGPAARAAAGPLAGLAATWVLLCLTPFGRKIDALAYHGRFGTAYKVRALDLYLLETITVASVVLGLAVLVLVAGVRGEWRRGLRASAAVLGALLSVEVLKLVLPTIDFTGRLQWPAAGSFPSGHTVIVTSISLAVLSVSTEQWRRRLVGPLVAWTAVATTATVTLGWHRPSDVLGSFFLATAWHRALGVRRPTADQLRRLVPAAAGWWSAACLLVLGAALEGVASGRALADGGFHQVFAYLLALAGLLAAAVVTVTFGVGDRRPPRHGRSGGPTGPLPAAP
jgi:membrane-associated phospholipid phosphatase